MAKVGMSPLWMKGDISFLLVKGWLTPFSSNTFSCRIRHQNPATSLCPAPGAVIHAQNLQLIAFDPVRDDVRCPRHDELPCGDDPARPTGMWQRGEPLDARSDRPGHRSGSLRVVLGDMGLQCSEVV